MANFKQFLKPVSRLSCESTGLLVLRMIAGLAFVFHGWGKIQNPFAWMGPDAPVPGVFQFLAALSEFGGGIAWILGLLMPLANLGIGFTMIVAVYTHMIVMRDPFVNTTGAGGAYELAAVYFGVAVLFFTTGPGKFSADAKLFGTRENQV